MATEVSGYWANLTLFVPVPVSAGDKGAVAYVEKVADQIKTYCLDPNFGLAGNATVVGLGDVWRAERADEKPGHVYLKRADAAGGGE